MKFSFESGRDMERIRIIIQCFNFQSAKPMFFIVKTIFMICFFKAIHLRCESKINCRLSRLGVVNFDCCKLFAPNFALSLRAWRELSLLIDFLLLGGMRGEL